MSGYWLCPGNGVATLHQKHLLSDNDLEAVRDFPELEVKEAKSSRLLQSVKNVITVTGVATGILRFSQHSGKFQFEFTQL